jgi:hypothetical protein
LGKGLGTGEREENNAKLKFIQKWQLDDLSASAPFQEISGSSPVQPFAFSPQDR